MKLKVRAVLAVFFAAALLLLICTVAHAAEPTDSDIIYRAEQTGEGYRLVGYRGETYVETVFGDSLSSLLSHLGERGVGSGRRTVRFDDFSYTGDLTVSAGELRFIGTLTMTDGSLSVTGGSLLLDGLVLDGRGSAAALRQSGGRVTLSGGCLTADAGAVVIDGTDSVFCLSGGEITTRGAASPLSLLRGHALLGVGSVRGGDAAVTADGSLTLAAGCRLSGRVCEIDTSSPVSLSGTADPFDGAARIRYRAAFAEGSFTPVCTDVREGSAVLSLTDADGRTRELCFFSSSPYTAERDLLAVYLPLTVRYLAGDTTLAVVSCLAGESLTPPTAPARTGYAFDGFFVDPACTEPFLFSGVSRDTTVYLGYRLLPPAFLLGGLSFVYDGARHSLSFRSLTHPLDGEGTYHYAWYRDGAALGISSSAVTVGDVSDSGSYSCKVTFSYQGDSVSVFTPQVPVVISPATVVVPSSYSVLYTGTVQYPPVTDTAAYTVRATGATDAGDYTVTLILRDPANYRFSVSDAGSVDIPFLILPAVNRFLTAPAVSDTYVGIPPAPRAETLFGTVAFTYSDTADGVYTSRVPTSEGVWYLRATVPATANYGALVSPPVSFTIRRETCIGLTVISAPTRTRYAAFDIFDPEGLVVSATYDSGRSYIVTPGELAVRYARAETLRFGDDGVTLSYGGVSVPLPLTVTRATYDLSSLVFADATVTFDGTYHTIAFAADVPSQDGIPLLFRVSGGGMHAGTYTVTLTPYGDSTQYEIPASRHAMLTVLPAPLIVTVLADTFVYDGTPHLPQISVSLPDGSPAPVVLSGARTAAGSYEATLWMASADYLPDLTVIPYTVTRAPLDLSAVSWSGDCFLYDGEEKSVSLTGLPPFVLIAGYADAHRTEAGVYTATASLVYDTANYDGPLTLTHTYTIAPAEYDMRQVSFPEREAIFTGAPQYPLLAGSLPVGVDGSSPSYVCSTGVTHVGEGRVAVTITFTAGSGNYRDPAPLITYVTILPRPVTVTWSALSFSYDGTPHAPIATSSLTAVSVTGAASDAGEYEAVAVSLDPDYTVRNGRMRYRVTRGNNRFLTPPTVSDIYEGDPLSYRADAAFGTVRAACYTDPEATTPAAFPLAPGVYYLVLSVPEDANVFALSSPPLRFTVTALHPVSLSASIPDGCAPAFSDLSALVTVTVRYNSGREEVLPRGAFVIRYASGEALRVGDTSCEICAAGLSVLLPLTVTRARYDTGEVRVTDTDFIYDGEPHTPRLTGLPDGVTVMFPGYTEVGTYTVTPVVSYDALNYEPPVLPACTMRIHHAVLPFPDGMQTFYDGTLHVPALPDGLIADGEGVCHAGTYALTIRVADPAHYRFPDGQISAVCAFTILPRPMTLTVGDLTLRHGAPFENPSYTASGLIPGDVIEPTFFLDGDRVGATVSHPDYVITVVDGQVTRSGGVLSARTGALSIAVLFTVLLALLCFVLLYRRTHSRPGTMCTALTPAVTPLGTPDSLLAVSAARADALITDALARSLLLRDGERVITCGHRRCEVAVDAIDAAFSSGEVVDINTMKERGLLPADAGSVRITAQGILSRRLVVVADGFDLAAVKMIALTGGTARRTRTLRRREKK